MMQLRVVIPSWSRLPPELESETGCKHAAFIPLGGQPLYRHIVQQYQHHYVNSSFKLVLPPSGAMDVDSLFNAEFDVETVLQEQSTSIAMTVLSGLQSIGAGDSVVVNMADTLVKLDKGLQLDSVYTDCRNDLHRWTSVRSNLNGMLEFPSDRNTEELVTFNHDVCVGIFSFSDGYRLKTALEKAIASQHTGCDPFFIAVSDYSFQVRMSLYRSDGWFDCGHVDTYYESRLSYQNLRHFNNLRYDSVNGQVTKTSLKKEQFRHQVRWFKQVPDDLSAFLPRIFESSDGEDPYITMELLSIPSLSDIFVTKRISLGAWSGVARSITHIQSELNRYRFRTSLAPQLARNMYLDKTRSRLEDFVRQNPLALDYSINTGERIFGLREVFESLDQFVHRTGILDIDSLSPIHGDFCFSNLLFDPKVRLVKMIDPRGEFGIPGIYGDPRYDLAKLSHSFSDGYDFIVSDRFTVALSTDAHIEFSSEMSTYHDQVRSIFETLMLPDLFLRKQVLAIQALLFLSMLPLHMDKPKRQLAMLAIGMRLFDRADSEGGAK